MNRKLRVVLAHITPISWLPVGIGMIAAVLEREDCEVYTIINNFKNYREVDDLRKEILTIEPDIVGISFMTFGVKFKYALANMLKKEKVILIAGGNHPTLFPEESIKNGFDIAVIGEGEIACKELVKYIREPEIFPLSNITGIWRGVYSWDASQLQYNFSDRDIPGFTTLTDLTPSIPFWLKNNASGNFTFSGTTVTAGTTTWNMISGWNMVGYPSITNATLASALSTIAPNYTGVYAWDVVNLQYWIYDTSIPADFWSLTHMNPGLGYWVKTNSTGALTI